MPDDPLRLYCPLCDKDYALAAFASHVEFPKHISAQGWAQRATVEHLIAIKTLLQQLVDKGQQVAPSSPPPPRFSCRDCAFVCETPTTWTTHHLETRHTLGLVEGRPPG